MKSNKSYKVYTVVLSDIRSSEADAKFTNFIKGNKYGWWRYTAFYWIIFTPLSVTTKDVVLAIVDSYGDEDPFYVFEVDIKNAGGMHTPDDVDRSGGTPFSFFEKLEEPGYKFPWERLE